MAPAARGHLDEHSDVDLAVEGIDPAQLFAAWSDAECAAPGFRIEVVELERVPDALRERIGREGIDVGVPA